MRKLLRGNLRRSYCEVGRHIGPRAGCGGIAANGGPDFTLVLRDGGFRANRGMYHGFPSSECVAAVGPAAVFYAKHIERERLGADRNDAVLADDAVLLAAGNHFTGEQQQRFFAAIYQDELVHLRAAGDRWAGFAAAISQAAHVVALFGDDGFTVSES